MANLTITSLTSAVGTLLTTLLGWLSDVFETMVSSPIVLIFVILAIIGAVIGFAKKVLM